jgi:hypothetical protein
MCWSLKGKQVRVLKWATGSVADPDPGWIKNQDPDPGSIFFSESLETIFLVKILTFFYVDPDPGSRIFLTLDPESSTENFGSGIHISDPQH